MESLEEEWNRPKAWPNSCTATVNKSVLLLLSVEENIKPWSTSDPFSVLLLYLLISVNNEFGYTHMSSIWCTSIAPALSVIKVCVTSKIFLSWEECMCQCASLAIKRISILMVATGEGDFDVCLWWWVIWRRVNPKEMQMGDITPCSEGMGQNEPYQPWM